VKSPERGYAGSFLVVAPNGDCAPVPLGPTRDFLMLRGITSLGDREHANKDDGRCDLMSRSGNLIFGFVCLSPATS
jgi:hypothetical protein